MIGKRLIQEWLLSVQSLDGAARWQSFLSSFGLMISGNNSATVHTFLLHMLFHSQRNHEMVNCILYGIEGSAENDEVDR